MQPAEEDGAAEETESSAAAGRIGLRACGGEAEREGKETTETQQAAGAVPEDQSPGPEPEEEPLEAGTFRTSQYQIT